MDQFIRIGMNLGSVTESRVFVLAIKASLGEADYCLYCIFYWSRMKTEFKFKILRVKVREISCGRGAAVKLYRSQAFLPSIQVAYS